MEKVSMLSLIDKLVSGVEDIDTKDLYSGREVMLKDDVRGYGVKRLLDIVGNVSIVSSERATTKIKVIVNMLKTEGGKEYVVIGKDTDVYNVVSKEDIECLYKGELRKLESELKSFKFIDTIEEPSKKIEELVGELLPGVSCVELKDEEGYSVYIWDIKNIVKNELGSDWFKGVDLKTLERLVESRRLGLGSTSKRLIWREGVDCDIVEVLERVIALIIVRMDLMELERINRQIESMR